MRPRIKKPAVQLTSLLDLLFIMVFLSLLQTKDIPQVQAEPTPDPPSPAPTVTKEPTPEPEPVAEPQQASVVDIRATFHFYPISSNREALEGTFLMGGEIDQGSGELKLVGLSWIDRPRGYDMVPLIGVIDGQQGVFRGQIDFAGCEEFTLNRIEKTSATPYSGKWKGKYRCLQGETGLTLTIH